MSFRAATFPIYSAAQVETVRLAASKALVGVATEASAVLVVALGGICQRVNGVLTNNKPSLTVRTNLLELLVRLGPKTHLFYLQDLSSPLKYC